MKRPLTGRRNCGAVRSEVALFGSNPSHPEPIRARIGTFDDDPGDSAERSAVRGVRRRVGTDPDDRLPRFLESRQAADARPL